MTDYIRKKPIGLMCTMLQDGLTPLHCACRSGHEKVVDLMLEKGASVSTKTKVSWAGNARVGERSPRPSARILFGVTSHVTFPARFLTRDQSMPGSCAPRFLFGNERNLVT